MTCSRVVALLALIVSVSAQAPAPIPLFISSAGATNGLTDPSKDNRDTVKDLRDEFKTAKDVRIVETEAEAVVTLIVLGRETSQTTAGSFGGQARDRIVHVKLKAGEFETDLTASAQGATATSSGAWGKAAGKIAKQVREWVAANRARLAP